jgi:hypothetical protein
MQIRKCERFTSYRTTEVANLDPEMFRNLSTPFEGETEEDFLNYIKENSYDLTYDVEGLDEETVKELEKLSDPDWEEYSNTAWHGEDSWYELGKENKEYRRTGGFEVFHTTDTEEY